FLDNAALESMPGMSGSLSAPDYRNGRAPDVRPPGIFQGHTSDEQSDLARERAPAAVSRRSRPPTPIGFPALAVSTQHRCGPHDEQRPAPATEPATGQD